MCSTQDQNTVQLALRFGCCYATLRLYVALDAVLKLYEDQQACEYRQPLISQWYIE